jgi:hypothetical protein
MGALCLASGSCPSLILEGVLSSSCAVTGEVARPIIRELVLAAEPESAPVPAQAMPPVAVCHSKVS